MRGNYKRGLAVLIALAVGLTSVSALQAKETALSAGGWTERDGCQYYIGRSGRRLFGWQQIDGRQHYFNQNGALASIQGIDVSEFQYGIDWKQVKEEGYEFAFLRLGYRGSVWENIDQDSYFWVNMENARDAGMAVGVYFYSQAVNTEEAEEEARFVLDVLSYYDGLDYPVVLDLEESVQPGRVTQAGLSRREYTDIALAFCLKIREAGYTPMVYSYQYILNEKMNIEELERNGIDLWYAYYGNPSRGYDGTFSIWQYTDTGQVAGIYGEADLNAAVQDYSGKKQDLEQKGSLEPLPGENMELEAVHGARTRSAGPQSLQVSWQEVPNADGYFLYRRQNRGGYIRVADVKDTVYTDTQLQNGMTYEYQVAAYQVTADGYHVGKFPMVGTLPAEPDVAVPAGLSAAAGEEGTCVRLNWSPAEGADGYCIYKRQPGGQWKLAAQELQDTFWIDRQVRLEQEYQYRVSAIHRTEDGERHESAFGEEKTVSLLRGRYGCICGYPVLTPQMPEGQMMPYVQELQEILGELGYQGGSADGVYGIATMFDVQNFQNDYNLPADRVIDGEVWRELFYRYRLQTGQILPETSVEESDVPPYQPEEEESRPPEESSREEESRAPEESSREEESRAPEENTGEEIYCLSEGDTYYGILNRFYGEFSEELLEAFCSYNGITPQTILHGGDEVKCPPRELLGV